MDEQFIYQVFDAVFVDSIGDVGSIHELNDLFRYKDKDFNYIKTHLQDYDLFDLLKIITLYDLMMDYDYSGAMNGMSLTSSYHREKILAVSKLLHEYIKVQEDFTNDSTNPCHFDGTKPIDICASLKRREGAQPEQNNLGLPAFASYGRNMDFSYCPNPAFGLCKTSNKKKPACDDISVCSSHESEDESLPVTKKGLNKLFNDFMVKLETDPELLNLKEQNDLHKPKPKSNTKAKPKIDKKDKEDHYINVEI